jgi:putative intracellular protease/amidase
MDARIQRRVAVVLYPGCIFFEISAVSELLADRCEVKFLSSHDSIHVASNGSRILTDGILVDPRELSDGFDAIIVPGGNPDSIVEPHTVDSFITCAYDSGAIIAGICAGSLVIANAGLTMGVRITHNYTDRYAPPEIVAAAAPIFDGSIYEESDVVVDSNVITAQPWASIKFAATVARQLGVLSQDEYAAYLGSHRQEN